MAKDVKFLGFQCSDRLAQRIEKQAHEEERSIASVIRRAIEAYYSIIDDI